MKTSIFYGLYADNQKVIPSNPLESLKKVSEAKPEIRSNMSSTEMANVLSKKLIEVIEKSLPNQSVISAAK